MNTTLDRREFLGVVGAAGAAAGLGVSASAQEARSMNKPLFRISLAQWSLHRALWNKDLDHLDFATQARKTYGIEAVEYVNSFFKDRARDEAYLTQMRTRAADAGVKSLLIMVDGEGALGDPDDGARSKAVENHTKWLEAAKALGCHSVRVNAASGGSWEEQQKLAADGLRRLTELAEPYGLNVIVENHGGLSSNGTWLVGVIKAVGHERCGTLPDFGNFRVSDSEMYDRYKGVAQMMPFAKAVSAKSYDFDDEGNEVQTDYRKMMKIVLDAGYHGHVGIEYEGNKLSEPDGIRATKRLLERVRDEMGR